MAAFEDVKPGPRLQGVDPAGIAEIAQVSRFAPTPEPGVYTEVLSKSETQRLRGFLDFSAATAGCRRFDPVTAYRLAQFDARKTMLLAV